MRAPRWSDFRDPLDAINARFRPGERPREDGRPLSGDDRRALKTLGLNADADRRALRQRYSDLVRRYHPDRNGGDRSKEGELQKVVEAYNALKGLSCFRLGRRGGFAFEQRLDILDRAISHFLGEF